MCSPEGRRPPTRSPAGSLRAAMSTSPLGGLAPLDVLGGCAARPGGARSAAVSSSQPRPAAPRELVARASARPAPGRTRTRQPAQQQQNRRPWREVELGDQPFAIDVSAAARTPRSPHDSRAGRRPAEPIARRVRADRRREGQRGRRCVTGRGTTAGAAFVDQLLERETARRGASKCSVRRRDEPPAPRRPRCRATRRPARRPGRSARRSVARAPLLAERPGPPSSNPRPAPRALPRRRARRGTSTPLMRRSASLTSSGDPLGDRARRAVQHRCAAARAGREQTHGCASPPAAPTRISVQPELGEPEAWGERLAAAPRRLDLAQRRVAGLVDGALHGQQGRAATRASHLEARRRRAPRCTVRGLPVALDRG